MSKSPKSPKSPEWVDFAYDECVKVSVNVVKATCQTTPHPGPRMLGTIMAAVVIGKTDRWTRAEMLDAFNAALKDIYDDTSFPQSPKPQEPGNGPKPVRLTV